MQDKSNKLPPDVFSEKTIRFLIEFLNSEFRLVTNINAIPFLTSHELSGADYGLNGGILYRVDLPAREAVNIHDILWEVLRDDNARRKYKDDELRALYNLWRQYCIHKQFIVIKISRVK